eukprot:TRINITY_DN1994_c0_g3_i1.p1 TRINITY_DN1994_c0_g3~~TRINITY_DN1994_c0_g3_i1.p1  ORF type:complete len:213 (+),score=18.98 TRINITY_DN1994_c0_g3_i1:42-680(+)
MEKASWGKGSAVPTSHRPQDCPDRQESDSKVLNGVAGFSKFGSDKAQALIVVDFDLTISSLHVWNTLARTGSCHISSDRIPNDLSTEVIFGGADRLSQLSDFLSTLTSRGAQLLILTNNHSDVVRKCMALSGLDRYVPDVIGRDKPGTKGQIVAELRERIKGNTKWIFVDDDPANVRSVSSSTQGQVATLTIEGGSGMQKAHFQKVISMAFS